MSILSRLFGGGSGGAPAAQEVEPEIYRDFQIYAEPIEESGRWRIAGRIEKSINGTLASHRLIRADMLDSREDAIAQTNAKARQVIDEQGDRLFR